ncbi:hypothetical protein ONZ45_g18932 [Pleurotus djamor]|nr:hypothetical protein ONZ45_g18932 [Pleurotus djamor]
MWHHFSFPSTTILLLIPHIITHTSPKRSCSWVPRCPAVLLVLPSLLPVIFVSILPINSRDSTARTPPLQQSPTNSSDATTIERWYCSTMLRRPRLNAKAKAAATENRQRAAQALPSTTSQQYALIPLGTASGSSGNPSNLLPLARTSAGTVLSQQANLPPRPGQFAFVFGFQTDPLPPSSPTPAAEDPLPEHTQDDLPPPMSLHRRKKEKQWRSWLGEVIPSIVPAYLDVVARTRFFRLSPTPQPSSCTCVAPPRPLNVVIVRFHVLESIRLDICGCRPAALQLIERGVFPCAPFHPSLAVDIRVLEFVTQLFVRLPPNNTAWSQALEEFLRGQGFRLSGEDTLRRRFANAHQFYNCLQHKVLALIDSKISELQELEAPISEPHVEDGLENESDEPADEGAPPTTPARERHHRSTEDSAPAPSPVNPFEDPATHDRPSSYLRRRCPACFGGKFPFNGLQGPDVIVCIDACLTQKRRPSEKDPVLRHPRLVFIPDAIARSMEAYINDIRGTHQPTSQLGEDEEDTRDDRLPISNAVLAGCEKSFTAADDSRQKSSSQFFDSTALMGLLCRHDRVLWLVNMTSAGEKQHYAFTLIETLFQHIPMSMSHHRRLFVLDMQVHHDDQLNLMNLGSWLSRKQILANEKRDEAEQALRITEQTKPLSRQSKDKGKSAVQEALRLMKARDVLRERVGTLQAIIADLSSDDYDVVDAEASLPQVKASLRRAEDQYNRKCSLLDAQDEQRLRYLICSPYINLRMNTLAVKTRLRDNLRKRRFEIAPLERTHRRKALDENLRRHTQDAIHRREPGLQSLARQYNTMVDQMDSLIKAGKAPTGATLPSKIPTSGLFLLDIDDPIWQDTGLEDETVAPPAWLADESVCEGIRALLIQDRCDEEDARLMHERRALQQWFSEEWTILNQALVDHDDSGLRYQFELRKQHLIDLYATWKRSFSWMAVDHDIVPPWGPSDAEITRADVLRKSLVVDTISDPIDSDDEEEEVDEQDDDGEGAYYLAALEAVTLADTFRGPIDDDSQSVVDNPFF